MGSNFKEETVAMLIDPVAWEDIDNLSPTAREVWEEQKPRRQIEARKKARKIIQFLR